MVKVIKIVEDNAITGVKYGTVEIPETALDLESAKSEYDSARAKIRAARNKKIRAERTKNK